MENVIYTQEISAEAFAPYGDLFEAKGTADKIINQGKCGRFHDRAKLDFTDGRAGISLFHGDKRSLPLRLEMVERHPLGSQAFIPMTWQGFLVVVADDDNGCPKTPEAFLTSPGQGINFHRNTWHGVLTPLSAPGIFAVIDRIGEGDNLEEYWFEEAYVIR